MSWKKNVGDTIEPMASFDTTFPGGWSTSGVDFGKWSTDVFWPRSLIINAERQYYLSQDEVAQYGVTAPWRVGSNGNLQLEVKPVPAALKNTYAFMGNINDYVVTSGAANSKALTLELGGDASRAIGLMERGGWVQVWHAGAAARKPYQFTTFSTNGTRVTLNLVQNLSSAALTASDKKAQLQAQQEFLSGILTTRAPGQFGQVRGRFEIRCKFPKGQQLFPAFWLLGKRIANDPYPQSTEFDVVENYGHDPSLVFFTYHSPNKQNNPNGVDGQKNFLQVRYDTLQNPPTIDFSAGFHTFTLDWTPDGDLIWGLDGKVVAVQPLAGIGGANIDKNGLDIEREKFLLVNLAIGSGDSRAQIERDRPNRGPGVPATFPSVFEIQSIKAYQYKNQSGGGTTNPPQSGSTSITVTNTGTNRVIAGTASVNLKGRGLYVDMKNGNGYSVTVSSSGTWTLTVPSSNDGQSGKQVSVYGQAADGTTDTKVFTYSIGGGGSSGNALTVSGTGRTVSGTASSIFVGRDVYIDMKNGRGYSARVQTNGTWSYAVPSSEDAQRGVQVSAYVQAASGESATKSFAYTTN